MLEVLGQPYIRAASAKGVPWARVVTGHALPNAAIAVLTIVGFMVGNLIAGTVLVESVFSWPGIGSLLVVSVASRDLAVVQCILLVVAAAMITTNVTIDLLYGVLDPRMRASCALGGHNCRAFPQIEFCRLRGCAVCGGGVTAGSQLGLRG
ncbi:ABC-type dipeptide/oligopeptide/nickel transport system permease component [Bradyrhizobium sp. GM7.3]